VFPLVLPQVVSLVTGMDPLDPEFRQRWTACLEYIGRQIFAPDEKSSDPLDHQKADKSAGKAKRQIKNAPAA
jgi:hypothetical protein